MARKDQENKPPRLVDAQIRCDYRGFQHCDVRDLNMHGVFVIGRDGALTRLPKDSSVDVALKFNADGQSQVHRLRARIEARTRDGTTLVFTDADLEAYSTLLHIDTAADR
jgi:hypothetical protein